jgi:hypothetical protein
MSNIRGLGDLIAFVLIPLKPLLKRLGFDEGVDGGKTPKSSQKKSCGCAKRRENLNKMFPNPLDKHKSLLHNREHPYYGKHEQTPRNGGQ